MNEETADLSFLYLFSRRRPFIQEYFRHERSRDNRPALYKKLWAESPYHPGHGICG